MYGLTFNEGTAMTPALLDCSEARRCRALRDAHYLERQELKNRVNRMLAGYLKPLNERSELPKGSRAFKRRQPNQDQRRYKENGVWYVVPEGKPHTEGYPDRRLEAGSALDSSTAGTASERAFAERRGERRQNYERLFECNGNKLFTGPHGMRGRFDRRIADRRALERARTI